MSIEWEMMMLLKCLIRKSGKPEIPFTEMIDQSADFYRDLDVLCALQELAKEGRVIIRDDESRKKMFVSLPLIDALAIFGEGQK